MKVGINHHFVNFLIFIVILAVLISFPRPRFKTVKLIFLAQNLTKLDKMVLIRSRMGSIGLYSRFVICNHFIFPDDNYVKVRQSFF